MSHLSLARADLLRSQCYIDGQWVDADTGESFAVTNPATGDPIGQVPDAGASETRRAIDAAEKAQPGWAAKTAKERAAILRRFFTLMMDHQEDLAQLMTAEQGKPLTESRGEIVYAANFIEWFAEEGKRVYGDVIPTHAVGKRIVVLKQPIGVCAAITPWNFPAAMITRKIGPALAAGCAIVVKPAEHTPLSALALCVLAEEAGIPAGILSCVTGDAATIGGELTSNPVVRKLSFTGSTEVGKLLMRQCADNVKKVSLELGGNAPFLVFDDADIDAAISGAIAAKFRNAGQTCVCTNRFLVQDGIYDQFVEKLAAATAALTIGNGAADGTDIGPLIDPDAVAKAQDHLDDAKAKGATIITGGDASDKGALFFQPTVISEATAEMKVAREETFGPLAAVFRFQTEEEAVRLANDTEFGLSAYFYTNDLGRCWRVAEALEYGIVGINEGIISTEVAPFGGIKESGIGREGSRYGIEDYLEIKYMLIGGLGI
ncbi:NAD-dependent succinate-semialdehyde dehydrogenase [Parasphingorhabdus sp.]|uniref:NAD-dependent succinate-semialdehyde dehydrogenase n=1 Tax=Parasphingorhabdus sp. TaxID=2709688 RepID=UPI0032666868